MKKHMTDEEIIDLFDSTADKEAVVDAVAVSLRTTRTGAREKLRELGCEIEVPLDGFVPVEPKFAGRHRKMSTQQMDELRAMQLFNDGLDDLGMAEALGVTVQRVKAWRSRMHLQRPRGLSSARKVNIDAAAEPAAVAPTACQPGRAVDVNWNDIEPAPEETPPAVSTEPVDAPQAMTAQQFLALAPELLTPRVARMPLMLDGKLVHDVAEVRIVVRGDQPCVDIRLAG